MKRIISGLLVLSLSLNTFSALAMERWVEEDVEERTFDELPDDMIFDKICSFLDPETLGNMRLTNYRYKKGVDAIYDQTFYLRPRDFEIDFFSRFYRHSESFNYKKAADLVRCLEAKIVKHGHAEIAYYGRDGGLDGRVFRMLDGQNFKDMIFELLEHWSQYGFDREVFLERRFSKKVLWFLNACFLCVFGISSSPLMTLSHVSPRDLCKGLFYMVVLVCALSLVLGCAHVSAKVLTPLSHNIRKTFRKWRLRRAVYTDYSEKELALKKDQ